ncbi:MAG: TetR/AcrR family transcriptional regulator, partial [Legionella sp.]|nr:TetR/AcrR family transcriptional regulator [Legionella sp.]
MMSKSNKKEFNRESLLNEGVALFMGQGYHGTGLQEILDAVNVPKGSFYNYFDSKEDFGANVIQHYIGPFIAQLAGYLDSSGTD